MVENDYLKLRQLSRAIRDTKERKYTAIEKSDWENSTKERLKELNLYKEYKEIFDKCRYSMSDKELQFLHIYFDSNENVISKTFNNANDFFEL